MLGRKIPCFVAFTWHNRGMNDSVVRARVDPTLKIEAEAVFQELGISTTEAIRMFLSQVRLRRGLPFRVETLAANDDLLVDSSMRQAALDSVFDD
jgi:DNA-damage-inducible protein J